MTVTSPTLFEQPTARLYDPPTSQRAAERASEKAETHRQLALRILRDNPAGLTDFELGDLASIPQTSIGKRRLELQRAGLVVRTEKRRPSPSGALAIVWRAA